MPCIACYAKVERDRNAEYPEPVSVQDIVAGSNVPNCCELGDICDRSDIYAFYSLDAEGGGSSELVFLADDKDGIERLFIEIPNKIIINRIVEDDLCAIRSESGKTCYVFSGASYNEMTYSAGDLDLFIQYRNSDISVVKVHLFASQTELYRIMVADLSELSTALVRAGYGSVTEKTDGEEPLKSTMEDSGQSSRYKRDLSDPKDADKYLDKLEKIISDIQKHAETDLRQVYKKLPIRKAKHLTPRTLVEYGTSQKPKVNVLTIEEHFDIYEHRMIRNYLLNLQEEFRRKIILSEEREKELKCRINEIEDHKLEVEGSLRAAGVSLTEVAEIKQTLENSKKDITAEKEREGSEIRPGWWKQINRIDEMISEYPFLQVRDSDEIFHSSMLFLRNRYYRVMYENMRVHSPISVYKNINAMPTQKLWKLYERWCYFKIISILVETYGFYIYAFSTVQGVLDQSCCRNTSVIKDVIRSMISDVQDMHGNYLCVVLKKKPETGQNEKFIGFSTDDQYIKIEYQRKFRDIDPNSKEEYRYPDFCLTFGRKICDQDSDGNNVFDIYGKTFILDPKFKYYSKSALLHELLYVSWYKYTKAIGDDDLSIEGSYILHPDSKQNFVIDRFNKQENYGIFGQMNICNEYLDCEFSENSEKIIELEQILRAANDEKTYGNINKGANIGCFYFAPDINDHDGLLGVKKLFRMILEYKKPFEGAVDSRTGLVWRKCLICGGEVLVKTEWTCSDYPKYHITCKKCGEFWVKSHCVEKNCHINLIKHIPFTNYLFETTPWFVECPNCKKYTDMYKSVFER